MCLKRVARYREGGTHATRGPPQKRDANYTVGQIVMQPTFYAITVRPAPSKQPPHTGLQEAPHGQLQTGAGTARDGRHRRQLS